MEHPEKQGFEQESSQQPQEGNQLLQTLQQIENLPEGITLVRDISDEDYDFVQKIIHSTDLSYYEIQKEQFYVLKNTQGDIVAFCRVFPIGPNQLEMGSLWVAPEQRGKKLGYHIMKALVTEKKGDAELYGACKRELAPYYNALGLEEQTDLAGTPEKLLCTKKRAEEQGYDFYLMKYKG